MGTSSATSQPESRAAAGQFSRPAVRTGDYGTISFAATVAPVSMIAGIQNSQ